MSFYYVLYLSLNISTLCETKPDTISGSEHVIMFPLQDVQCHFRFFI